MIDKKKRKEQNRKYYLANSGKWKQYRINRIEKSAAIVKQTLRDRRESGHDDRIHAEI